MQKRPLIVLVFSQFCASGAIAPLISLYLKESLGFSGAEAGLILSTSVISSLIAPLVAAVIADKYVSTRAFLLALDVVLAVLAVALALVKDYLPVFTLYFLFTLVSAPLGGLLNALILSSLDKPENYGKVRLWGTLGWIFSAWGLSLMWMVLPTLVPGFDVRSGRGLIFWLAAVSYVVSAIVAVAIGRQQPVTEKLARATQPSGLWARVFPHGAFRVIAQEGVVLLLLTFTIFGFLNNYMYFGAAPTLSALGVGGAYIPLLLSINQVTEIVFLALLSRFLRRFGVKRVILIGIAFQILRMALMAANILPLAILSLPLHGLIVAFISGSISVEVDGRCPPGERAATQQVFMLFGFGIGSLAANTLAGFLSDRPEPWPLFWIVAAVCAAVSFALFLRYRNVKATG